MNLRKKIILAISCIIAIVIALFIINKIETAPQQIPATAQPTITQISSPEPPTEISTPIGGQAVPVSKEVPLEKEYPKQVIIGLRSWSDVESAKKIITDNGGQITKTLKWPTKNVLIAVLPDKNTEVGILKNSFWGKLIGGIGFASFGNKLSGGIDFVEKDVKVPAQAINPIDWGVARMKADKVWNAPGGSTGKGVKVAVIDSGIQRDHPDLAANLKGGISFMPGSPDQWDDEHGHGTEVAGLIAAANNDIGYVGVAPEASLYAVKVMGKDGLAATSDFISGIYWAADNGMNVANLSLGVYMDPTIYSKTIGEETAAVNYAYAHGVVLVASSGNSGTVPDCDRVVYPAAIDNVIAVGATYPDNTIASFSCHGPEVDLVAPGLYNWAPGLGGSYGQHSGTSVASPFVAGVAALIKAKNPQFTPAQVRERLESTAVDLGNTGKDNYYGYGLVNAYDAIFPQTLPVTISLISPKGGEQWWAGTSQEVSWSMDNVPSGENVDKVDIQLIHQRGGTTESIPLALDTINDGKASVDIPPGLPGTSATDSYYLQINCAKSFVGKCQPAKSGPLNIAVVPPQALKIISPNGSEQWPEGTTQSVLWTANYFGGPNVDVALLEKIQVPTYSLISGSEITSCVNPLENCLTGYTGSKWNAAVPPLPSDTCNRIIEKDLRVGGPDNFSCPAINSSVHLRCLDVKKANNFELSGGYWERYVDCSYSPGLPFLNSFAPVKPLAQNVVNNGSAEISVPNDLLGSNYLIQLSCANFTGECAKGLSSSPFSIIRLENPKILTINKSGVGTVTTDGNIICGSNRGSCLENYESGDAVTLSAISTDPSVIFTGWSGACSGIGTCRIVMDGAQSVIAAFSRRSVTLTAIPDPGTVFTGWSGGVCSGTEPCQVTSENQPVTANFMKLPVITIKKAGNGIGDVRGQQINCDSACPTKSATYAQGWTETLTATRDSSKSTFAGWSGGICSGTGSSCSLTMDNDKVYTVTATFNAVVPPCTEDKWEWTCPKYADFCPVDRKQTRTCKAVIIDDCPSVPNNQPPDKTESQSCTYIFTPGSLEEVRP